MERILIIEDDADIAGIEKDYLALSGYSVDIESDGNSGLYAALHGKYDLITSRSDAPRNRRLGDMPQDTRHNKSTHSNGYGKGFRFG